MCITFAPTDVVDQLLAETAGKPAGVADVYARVFAPRAHAADSQGLAKAFLAHIATAAVDLAAYPPRGGGASVQGFSACLADSKLRS